MARVLVRLARAGSILERANVNADAYWRRHDMGYQARQNDVAKKAANGALMSRQSLMGAMDHALELHASALRVFEAKIVALQARVEKLEGLHPSVADITEAPPLHDDDSRCAICGRALAVNPTNGCIRGNCSMRPFPRYFFAPARAKTEYAPLLNNDPRTTY